MPLETLLKRLVGSTTVLFLLAAAVVLAALIGRVVARTTIVRLGYELSQLETKNQTLSSELNALRTELAARRAPEQLLREGRTHFQLDVPKPEQIITVTTTRSE